MTIETIENTNYILAVLSIVVFLVSTVLVVDLHTSRVLEKWVVRGGLWVAFLFTLIASGMAFVYSDVFGFVPCGLCWLQRVFLFSQVFLLATALYFRDTLVSRYTIVLSGIGLVLSLYQHYLQMGGSEFIRCPVAGAGADCAKRYFFEFGFLTFPLMSAILFIFLIALYLYILKTRKINSPVEVG